MIRTASGRPITLPAQRPPALTLAVETSGPGTELTKLLASIGITYTADCLCKSRAAKMDRLGCDWCQQNIATIVTWMQEEATARELPFSRRAAELLVRRAIARARRAQPTPPS